MEGTRDRLQARRDQASDQRPGRVGVRRVSGGRTQGLLSWSWPVPARTRTTGPKCQSALLLSSASSQSDTVNPAQPFKAGIDEASEGHVASAAIDVDWSASVLV